MSALFSIDDVERILAVANHGANVKGSVVGVSIDSRACGTHSLFVALKGEKTDGVLFLDKAFKAGAIAAVVQEESSDGSRLLACKELAERHRAALFIVKDSLKALQKLAAAHVDKFPALVRVGVTGSAGKTTAKEMIAAILSRAGATVSTVGNLNSETGLPLSCFCIDSSHKYAVLELGMNRPGEIEESARVYKPTCAAITNIGTAHVGMPGLGSIEAIAREKRAIFSQFTGRETAFIPQQDSFASYLAQGVEGRVIFYAPEMLNRFDRADSLGLDGWMLWFTGVQIKLNHAGRHNLRNACLAIAVAMELGVKLPAIKAGLEGCMPTAGRGEVVRGPVTLIRDYYNASPQGMRAALEAMKPLLFKRKAAILGAMGELGAESEREHAALAEYVMDAGLKAVFLLGLPMQSLLRALKERGYTGIVEYADDLTDLMHLSVHHLREGDLLLIKGSRACALERAEEKLAEKGLIWPSFNREKPHV